MKTVAFYSYKGGVGRTLSVAHTARYLERLNLKVCILDMDLEAPGVLFKFNKAKDIDFAKPGLVDYIISCKEDKPPKSISDYFLTIEEKVEGNQALKRLVEKEKPHSWRGYVKIMSAGAGLNNLSYWHNLSRINWDELFFSESQEGLFIFENLKHQIKEELEPDYLFIDSRTGVTLLSKLCVSVLPDTVVLLSVNNEENFYGTRLMYNHIFSSVEYKVNERKSDVFCVLSRIPAAGKEDKSLTDIISSFVQKLDVPNLANSDVIVIHSDRNIERDENSVKHKLSEKYLYHELAEKIIADQMQREKQTPKYFFIDYDVKKEVENMLKKIYNDNFSPSDYNDAKNRVVYENMAYENLYNLAIWERFYDKPIDSVFYLYNALDSLSDDTECNVCHLLGMIFLYDLSSYYEAEVCFCQIFNLMPSHNSRLLYDLAVTLYCLEKLDEALKHVDNYLEDNSADYRAHLLKANILFDVLYEKDSYTDTDVEKILGSFVDAGKLNDRCTHIYNCRGIFYRYLKRYSEAYNDFAKGIEIEPENFLLHYGKAFTYYEQELYTDALDECDTAIKLNSEYKLATNLRLDILTKIDEPKLFIVGNKKSDNDSSNEQEKELSVIDG